MKLMKVMAGAMLAGALAFGAIGTGGGIANAEPAAPAPLKPGHGHDDDCWPLCDNWRGNGPDWQHSDRDKGQWWATNRHDWWDDRNGGPPWGWGPPPAINSWWGWAPPPPRINYWGYDVNTVWNDGFNQWGFWLFGIWIPIFGVGVI